jgi:hypothetical protein
MRGRFAWLGAAVILFAVGGLATVGTQDTWLDGYGIIAYGLVPLAFIPFAAGAIASPRANRFVESVFTAPVEPWPIRLRSNPRERRRSNS